MAQLEDYPVRLAVQTRQRSEWVEITGAVDAAVRRCGCQSGAVLVYVPHTTAGLTINENADPDVAADMQRFMDELVPREHGFRHGEGNADAHIKASLMGSSVRVIVREGRLMLGRWQGIFLTEFDGPRQREVWVALDETTAARA